MKKKLDKTFNVLLYSFFFFLSESEFHVSVICLIKYGIEHRNSMEVKV